MAEIKAEIINILRRYLDDVERICHVDKAFIFGSYAHGRAGKHSDIDMAIFSRNVNDGNRLEIMTEAVALINKFKLYSVRTKTRIFCSDQGRRKF